MEIKSNVAKKKERGKKNTIARKGAKKSKKGTAIQIITKATTGIRIRRRSTVS